MLKKLLILIVIGVVVFVFALIILPNKEDSDLEPTKVPEVTIPVSNTNVPSVAPTHDISVLYKNSESWGPCPDESICSQTTIVYNSGLLVLEGANEDEVELDQAKMDEIEAVIRETNIMNIDCSTDPVLDYYSIVTINIDNQQKEIVYPGCQVEVLKIEEIFPEE